MQSSSSRSTLNVEIRPGLGLGINAVLGRSQTSDHNFEIGTSLWSLLDRLRNIPNIFPKVEVVYDPATSATTPIIIRVAHFDFLFSGKEQRLHTICIRKLRDPSPPITLQYKDIVISSATEVLKRVVVSRAFGPTYPGDELRYPGLWFSFEDDTTGTGEGPPMPGAVVDKAKEVKRVFISQEGNDGKEDALDEVKYCPVMAGEISRAILKVHDGIVLHFYGEQTQPLHIRIGETTAQDLILDLGTPIRVHYKEDERMTIHQASKKSDVADDGSYFFNYFQHGLDFLISGTSHVVKKIIVHTNLPGNPLFQRYQRCYWELEGAPEDDEDDSPPRKRFYDRFETINHFLSPHEPPGPPMQLDRTDEDETLTLPSPTTRLYGYDGIILEVTEASHIVLVILF